MQIVGKLKYTMYADETFDIYTVDVTHHASKYDPISAGFLSFETIKDEDDNDRLKANCFGKSLSLRLKSRPEDGAIITERLRHSV